MASHTEDRHRARAEKRAANLRKNLMRRKQQTNERKQLDDDESDRDVKNADTEETRD